MTATAEGTSTPKSHLAPIFTPGRHVDFRLHVFTQAQMNCAGQVPMSNQGFQFQTPTLRLLGAFLDLRPYGLAYPTYSQPLMEAHECRVVFSIKAGHPSSASTRKQDDYGFPWYYSYLSYTNLIPMSYVSITSEYDVRLIPMLQSMGEHQSNLVVIPVSYTH